MFVQQLEIATRRHFCVQRMLLLQVVGPIQGVVTASGGSDTGVVTASSGSDTGIVTASGGPETVKR